MKTNVQIIKKEFETFANGNTTRCIIRGKITLPKDLIELVSTFPGFTKFVNAQTMILWEDDNIEVVGIGHAYKHKSDVANSKLGEYVADTKAQKNMFRLAANFQDNLRWFIVQSLENDIVNGVMGCTYAMNSCDNHIDELKKKTTNG